ncbi:MAG: hypothetical protein H6618_08150 [Deltaproteobacteria bacterium]|nr:hypothetical protein [Deltaproteobacteria bacterium]
MVKISIVQGRLSEPVAGHYQHFPICSWQDEFRIAAELGLDGIEWIISDFSNPLFNQESRAEIKKLLNSCSLCLTSVSLDFLMHTPVYRLQADAQDWIQKQLAAATSDLDIARISLPVEESSTLVNQEQTRIVSDFLSRMKQIRSAICIETDLSPENALRFLSRTVCDDIGILLDIGNLASLGYKLEQYAPLKDRIYGMHIKDRGALFAANCRYGDGIAEIKAALDWVQTLPRLSSITLQSYRSPDRYLEDAAYAIQYVKNLLGGSDHERS